MNIGYWNRKHSLARPGDWQLTSRRQRVRVVTVSFVLGLTCGIYLHKTFVESAFASPNDLLAPRAIVSVGEDLCKGFNGLAKMARLDNNHFTFTCNDLATFPKVELVFAPRS